MQVEEAAKREVLLADIKKIVIGMTMVYLQEVRKYTDIFDSKKPEKELGGKQDSTNDEDGDCEME